MTALQLFGVAVRERRRQLGLTQHDLAAVTGFKQSYIGGVERGDRNVTLLTLLRFARALNMRPSQLLELLDTRPDLYPPTASDQPSE